MEKIVTNTWTASSFFFLSVLLLLYLQCGQLAAKQAPCLLLKLLTDTQGASWKRWRGKIVRAGSKGWSVESLFHDVASVCPTSLDPDQNRVAFCKHLLTKTI